MIYVYVNDKNIRNLQLSYGNNIYNIINQFFIWFFAFHIITMRRMLEDIKDIVTDYPRLKLMIEELRKEYGKENVKYDGQRFIINDKNKKR